MPSTKERGAREAGPQIIMGLVLAGAIVLGLQAATDIEDCGWGSSIEVRIDWDGSRKVRVIRGNCRWQIEAVGDMRFTTDERGIEFVERGAFLEIEERLGSGKRRLKVTAGPGGSPQYSWFVDGEAREIDRAARDWLAEMLPKVFRTTGLDAEGRVARLLAAGGPEAVLAEIAFLEGDDTQRRYLEFLLSHQRFSAVETEKLLTVAGAQIGSDQQLGRILVAAIANSPRDSSLPPALAKALRQLGSDAEHKRVLSVALRHPGLNTETFDLLLATATSIGSDSELADLMVEVATLYPAESELTQMYFTLLATLGSDAQLRRSLAAVLARPRLGRETLTRLLSSARGIGSDTELASFLIDVLRWYPQSIEVQPQFDQAISMIGSRSERQRILALLDDVTAARRSS